MDSKGDFCGDAGIWSTTGATLSPWISGELHFGSELVEVQVLHGEIGSKLFMNAEFGLEQNLLLCGQIYVWNHFIHHPFR